MTSITFARTRSAAKFNMLNSAREAGYYQRGRNFPSSLRAWRAPRYDYHSLNDDPGRKCWGEDYVAKTDL